jgi:hypothetical protein
MSDDLVKRLLAMDGDSMSIKTIDEAADRIEELEAKLANAINLLNKHFDPMAASDEDEATFWELKGEDRG